MKFRPERLTEAREARDLTMTALGDLVGRKPASISHYEKGRHEPRPDVVEALSKALSVRVGFFFQPPRPHEGGPTFFRSMAAATKRARTRAERRIDWVWDVLRFVEGHVEIQAVHLPEPPEKDWRALSGRDIETAASGLRRHWGLRDGPIPNLVWLVEHHGIVVVRDSIGNKHLDAHSRWCATRPILILNSDKMSAVRSRFDCAHELAHILLHQRIPEAELRRPENQKEIERQAHAFAGAFMMPAETFAAEVGHPTLEGLLSLKHRWKMSIGAMLKRCQRLRLISKDAAARMWRSRSRRGWSRSEPFDDTMLPEQPRMLGNAFELIVGDDLASREAVSAATELWPPDIENLAGLSSGFLSMDRTKVLPFRPIRLET